MELFLVCVNRRNGTRRVAHLAATERVRFGLIRRGPGSPLCHPSWHFESYMRQCSIQEVDGVCPRCQQIAERMTEAGIVKTCLIGE